MTGLIYKMVKNYFIFVNYRSKFCSQAICVPIEDIDIDLLKKINDLASFGNTISNVLKFDKNVGKSIGYEIDGILNNSKVVIESFNFWTGLVSLFDLHIYDDDYSDKDSSTNDLIKTNNSYYENNKFAYGIANPIYKNIKYFYLSSNKYSTDIDTIIDTIKSIFTNEISIYNYVILKEKLI
jgi:hypothetical protein